MFWPDYIVVLLFAVIVALVIYFGRQQARTLLTGTPRTKAAGDPQMTELLAEMKRMNDNMDKLVAGHEARIAALEAKAAAPRKPAKGGA
ncbi:MAG: hypothetical protein KDE55_19470 [Novosphingobium sp.]|nr:hypothetical protein [Novosphingobium sp.]